MVAHGSSEQSDDDLGRADLSRAHFSKALARHHFRPLPALRAFRPTCGADGPVPPPPKLAETVDDPLAALVDPVAGALKLAGKSASTLIEKGVAVWQDPRSAVGLAEKGSALTSEIAKLALMGEDSRTIFKGRPDTVKRVAWAEPIPLSDVKSI